MENIRRPVDRRGKYVDTIYTHDIPRVIEENTDALDFYFRYRKYGNPFAPRGWMYWPEWALDVISICDGVDWSNEPE
jgi:hypothetical protein